MPTCISIIDLADKEAKIKRNPCLTHTHITVRLQLDNGNLLWSHTSHYNDYTVSPKIEELYSGLLRKQVVDKTCVKSNGALFVPDIPDEIKKCVEGHPTTNTRRTETPTSTQFSFTIVDPKDDKLRKVIKTDFKVDEPCPHGDKESKKGKQDNEDSRDKGDKDDRGTQARTSPMPLPPVNNGHPDQRTNEDQLTMGIVIRL